VYDILFIRHFVALTASWHSSEARRALKHSSHAKPVHATKYYMNIIYLLCFSITIRCLNIYVINRKLKIICKVGTGCKEAGEKIMLVTFLVIYSIYSWRQLLSFMRFEIPIKLI
jgi:hypothetical protein